VRRGGEVPFSREQLSGFFAAPWFGQHGCRYHVGVQDQLYGRPSSMALWISSSVMFAPRRTRKAAS